jgi:hypothetical protein
VAFASQLCVSIGSIRSDRGASFESTRRDGEWTQWIRRRRRGGGPGERRKRGKEGKKGKKGMRWKQGGR